MDGTARYRSAHSKREFYLEQLEGKNNKTIRAMCVHAYTCIFGYPITYTVSLFDRSAWSKLLLTPGVL